MITETLKTHTLGAITIIIEVVDHCDGAHGIDELYTAVDAHEGGKTIANPCHERGSHKYYVGQTSPAELASSYAKQGYENPSKEAYASLQKELEHYIRASDCTLRATVTKAGVELARVSGINFEHSYVYDQSLEELGREMLKHYGLEFVSEAVEDARTTLKALAA